MSIVIEAIIEFFLHAILRQPKKNKEGEK